MIPAILFFAVLTAGPLFLSVRHHSADIIESLARIEPDRHDLSDQVFRPRQIHGLAALCAHYGIDAA